MDDREHFTPAMHRAAFERDERQRELARQLEREHRAGMAADRLEAERKRFYWDIEGWTGEDELQVHIAGMGTLRIAADEVIRFANALLAEHQIRFETCPVCGQPDNCGDCNHEPAPETWRTNADGSLVCPHRDLSVCPACSSLPGVTEVAGAHFYDPDGSINREVNHA